MASKKALVTLMGQTRGYLPDTLASPAAILGLLRRDGWLVDLASRIRIRRQGGFAGFDVVIYLLLYFLSPMGGGLSGFWAIAGKHAHQLGALAGRIRIPSPSSLSRAFENVELDLLRPSSTWLLGEFTRIDDLLRHRSTHLFDATGCAWRSFHFDFTVHAFHQRSLPKGHDLPVPRRQAPKIAKPGYAGRKRGDIQLRRATLQDHGSSAWLLCQLAAGNEERMACFVAAVEAVVTTCSRLGHSPQKALLCADGEFGSVPYYDVCQKAGIEFLCRLNRLDLLDLPEVRARLDAATWRYVTDSGAGPRRSVADLGMISVPPGRYTQRADGSSYQPLRIRVVVCRYPHDVEEAGRGRLFNKWQYEIFGTSADATAFPAPALMEMYFARTTLENSFAQEDREIDLDRIFSYDLPGQELAVLVGLAAWNMRLAMGFVGQARAAKVPKQRKYHEEIDHREAPRLSQQAAAHDGAVEAVEAVEAVATVEKSGDGGVEADDIDVHPIPENAAVEPVEHIEGRGTPSAKLACAPPAKAVRRSEEILQVLSQFDWAQILRNKDGWSWDSTSGAILCSEGQPLNLTSANKVEEKHGHTRIVFCRPHNGCSTCPNRCLTSQSLRTGKRFETSVPTAVAAELHVLLRKNRGWPPMDLPLQPPTQFRQKGRFGLDPPIEVAPGPYAVTKPALMPVRVRQRHDRLYNGYRAWIEVGRWPPTYRHLPSGLTAPSEEVRQRRRLTWLEAFNTYALPEHAEVRLSVEYPSARTVRTGKRGDPAARGRNMDSRRRA